MIALWHSGNSPQDLEVLVGADAVSAQLNAWDGTTFTHTPVPLTGTGAARKALVTVTGSPRFLKIQH